MPLTEQQARDNLKALLADYHRMTDEQRRSMSEASVVRQFIDRLLEEVLDWPIKDPQRYKYEMFTQAGRPDLTLFPETGGVIFVEAKKFGVIKELDIARYTVEGVITPGQMALPGMSTDRTQEEQQAINYAFENGGTWAILTNFEKLRLFNARRDWLVLSFERPGAYLTDFDQLWPLAYPNVLRGSLDAISNQRFARDIDSKYLDFINEWRERLALDILANRAANPWAFSADGHIDLPHLRAVVQRFLDRLVIVRCAEDRLVIPSGTLRSFYELKKSNFYAPELVTTLNLFFRRFDQAHNSALFAYDTVDRAVFSDETILPLIQKLYEVRYRAMPPDILGNTYEQYLGKALAVSANTVVTRDNLETRKKQGSYYTPQVIVRYIVDHSLGRWLYGTRDGQPDGEPVPGETRKTSRDLIGLRVLDSACGSGSFLIYAYDALERFYMAEIARLREERDRRVSEITARFTEITLDDRVAVQQLEHELNRIQHYPRLILEHHLYGVDLDPQAAEIAVVNLMMRAMEQRSSEKRLPLILNQNVKVGNGLVGLPAHDPRMAAHAPALSEIARLRAALVDTPAGEEHDRIIRDLEAATEALKALLNAEPEFARFPDLVRARPFHWGAEFPEVFYDPSGTALHTPGFTVIIGNPPWEILKPDLREYYAQFDALIEGRYTREQAETRITALDAEDPQRRILYEATLATIDATTAYTRASGAYPRQGGGDPATHKLFTERMWALLCSGGHLGYVIPSGIYTDLGTKPLREMLLNEGSIEYIYSFSNERFFFPGVHHSFKFAMLGAQKGGTGEGFWAAFRFNPRVAVAPDDLPEFLANRDNLIYVRRDTLKKFSPDSLSVMEFQSAQDYAIAEKIYSDHPLLGQTVADGWNVRFNREFDVTNDRRLFNTSGRGLPLYAGRMIHQFNAFYAQPEFWIEEATGRAALIGRRETDTGQVLDYQRARLAFRDIASATNERTLISAVLPPNVFANNKTPHVRFLGDYNPHAMLYLSTVMNSFAADFIMRQKVSTSMNFFYLETLPMPRLNAGNPVFDALAADAARLTCTTPAFAALWLQVMGTPWTESSGVSDPAERQRIRHTMDARVAHLYGLTRSEYAHVLAAFPLVFPPTAEGESRRAAALAAYDAV